MRQYRVEITDAAESDVGEIFQYIALDNRNVAEKFVAELERQVDSLEQIPYRCPIIPEAEELGAEYRHLLYGKYRTIFRIEGFVVIIMRVIHGSRLLSTGMLDVERYRSS